MPDPGWLIAFLATLVVGIVGAVYMQLRKDIEKVDSRVNARITREEFDAHVLGMKQEFTVSMSGLRDRLDLIQTEMAEQRKHNTETAKQIDKIFWKIIKESGHE